MTPFRHRPSVLVLLLVALALSSCGGSTTGQLSGARPTAASAEATPASDDMEEATPGTDPTAEPTEAPTAEPTEAALEVTDATVVSSGFAQDGQRVGFGVLVENPNKEAALEEVELQVAVYGEGDVVLATDDSTIPVLPPGIQTNYGGDVYLDAEAPVERIEVKITDGGKPEKATTEELPPFPVEMIKYSETSFSKQVSGVIGNPFTLPLTDLYVGIVLYDEADKIIGGGFTFLSALAPEGKSPFATTVLAGAAPARVEVSPLVSVLTLFGQRETDELPPLTLLEQGWGFKSQAGYSVVVENPDKERAMEGAQYNAAAYAEDGTVLSVDAGYFGLILPGTKSAHGGTMFINSDGPPPARVEVQVFPGRLIEVEDKKPFAFEDVNYLAGDFSQSVTAQILNHYDEPVESLAINAVLRDASGAIVGGGLTFTETIPASDKAAIEVNVVGGDVATVELYAEEVSITKIGGE